MKHRNPLAIVGLSIITLGIYDIYWLVVTKKELNQKTSQHTPTIWLLVAPVVILIVGYVILFSGGQTTSTTSGGVYNYNLNTTSGSHTNVLIGIIVLILGWIAVLGFGIYWFFKFSKAINEYTSGKMSTAVSFLILYLIHIIGVALIQDTFNDMLGGPAAEAQPAGSIPPPAGYTPPAAPTAPVTPTVSPTTPQPPAEQPTTPSEPTPPSKPPLPPAPVV